MTEELAVLSNTRTKLVLGAPVAADEEHKTQPTSASLVDTFYSLTTNVITNAYVKELLEVFLKNRA